MALMRDVEGFWGRLANDAQSGARLSRTVLAAAFVVTAIWGADLRAQPVWFGAVSNFTTPHGYTIDPDYPELFTTPSLWLNGLARIDTFIFTHHYIGRVDPNLLASQVKFLKQHKIHIAVAMPVVETTGGCGAGIEGMLGNPNGNHFIAERLLEAGGRIEYIIADEPYTFGVKSRAHGACRYSVQQASQSFADQVARVRQIFPHAQVVDNEASSYLKDLVGASEWVAALKAALGPKTPFVMNLDVQWEHKIWYSWVTPFLTLLSQQGVRFGIIYHSIGYYKEDLAWLQTAEQFARNWEATVPTPPAYIVLQSWNPAPSHVLPETDPTAMTSLILAYCNTISRFSDSCNGLHALP